MKKYLQVKDYKNLGDVAHKMKNTYGQLEAHAIMLHLVELEVLIDEKQAHKVVEEHVEQVDSLSQNLFTALRDEVEETV